MVYLPPLNARLVKKLWGMKIAGGEKAPERASQSEKQKVSKRLQLLHSKGVQASQGMVYVFAVFARSTGAKKPGVEFRRLSLFTREENKRARGRRRGGK